MIRAVQIPDPGDNETLIVNRNHEYVSPRNFELIKTEKFGVLIVLEAGRGDVVTATKVESVDPDLGW